MTRNHSLLGSGVAASALLFLSAQVLAAEALPHRSEPARLPRAAADAPAPQQEKLSASFDIKGTQHAAFSFTVGAPGKIAVSIQSKGGPVTGSLLTPGGVTVALNGASPYEYMASADDIKKGEQWKVEVSLAAPKSAPRNAVLNSDGHASGDITIVHPAGGNNGRQSIRDALPNANSGSARAAATHVTDQPLPHAPVALAQAGAARRNGEGSSGSAGNPNQPQPQPVSQSADQPQYQPGPQDQGQSQYQQYQPGPQDSGQGQYPQPRTGSQDSGSSQYPQPQPGPQDSGSSPYPQYQSGSQDSGSSQYPQYQSGSQGSGQPQYPAQSQQPDSPAVQSSLQQQSPQYQQPNYQGQQYQGQQYQGQQYQGQQYQGQQYQGQQYQGQQGQQYQGQQYQGQQPAMQQQNQAQPGYSPGGAAGGSCTVKLSVDRSTINLLDANTGSERKHLSLGQDRVQKVFTSPDNAWSVAVYKIRGAQQYGFIALELAKCEDQLPVDLPAVPSEARFDQAEVVLTIDNKEKHFPLRHSRMQ